MSLKAQPLVIEPESVAQIFNLPYRRFVICGAYHGVERERVLTPADYKSAIQQAKGLRYGGSSPKSRCI